MCYYLKGVAKKSKNSHMSIDETIKVKIITGVPFLNHNPGVIAKEGSFFSLAKHAFSGAVALATGCAGRPCVRPAWA